MFHQELTALRASGAELSLHIVSDDHPLSEEATRLWLDVYRDELDYLHPHIERSALASRDGRSLVLLALDGGRCVGTLRITYERHAPGAFEFANVPDHVRRAGGRLGALSRLVIAREFRRSKLSLHMLSQCHRFHLEHPSAEAYDYVLVACVPEMLAFYRTFGFARVASSFVRHPTFERALVLVGCSRETNDRVAERIERVLNGNRLAEAQLALRYRYYKLREAWDPWEIVAPLAAPRDRWAGARRAR